MEMLSPRRGTQTAVPIDFLIDPLMSENGRKIATVAARASIFLPGVNRSETFRILEGCIALYQRLPDGRRQILDVLGPGKMFGRGLSDVQQCGAEAMAPARLELVAAGQRRMEGELNAAVRLLLRRAQAHAMLLGRKTATEKVASALVDLCRQFAKVGAETAVLRFPMYLTRQDLADWLGLTLETVSRCISRLRREGYISLNVQGDVAVHDLPALRALAMGTVPPQAAFSVAAE
ncbi:helix-turn-helix domain-containing protein [Pannonibacter indicus]|uniref:cAMP-binding domain of CRP or a regulatory subunit of cAMP-dependent protein kinases n=1 Tax=Pannonibacter indicus TaxID=466044 RepID=A0A0K6HQE8_9HYPH|nr:helix-turn-helix domain-containing protein [Pannonibacter indicus]CUA93038.1 cAMP-binding domain of CRP or a regulatory subunit of cAMP-dependent protein kinases [Pannonibacter indicus]